MKLTIERADLLKSLAHVQSVVERRNTIPILSNVLLQAQDGKLAFTATDMDLTIVDDAQATVDDPGATTVPAHTFYDIVRKLPDGAEVVLDGSGDSARMSLRAGRSTFSLSSLPKEDFPDPGSDDLPQRFALAAADLKSLIDRTRFAISTEETRYYLNGIYLHAAESGDLQVLRAVATDGHRLARYETPLPAAASGMPGVIVPRKTVNELRKLIEESDGDVEIALSETRIQFSFGSSVLTSKLIDGTFPDYERVIPADNDKVLEINCRDFAEAVDRVSTISTEKSRAVKMLVDGEALTLSASSPESGSAEEAVEIGYAGPALEIGFNSRYLLDVAQQIGGEKVEIFLKDAASPTLMREAANPNALYVLMPMRV